MKCSVCDCPRSAEKRGWCGTHYQRWRRTGSLTLAPKPTAMERFLSKVRKQPGGCWIWTAGRYEDGYGMFWFGGTTVHAHRWSYEQFVGPVPEDRVLDHFACDTPACVNPTHMRPVTGRENVLRSQGVAAFNLAKTACVHGHPFTPENTYWFGPGRAYRACRTCKRNTDRETKRRAR